MFDMVNLYLLQLMTAFAGTKKGAALAEYGLLVAFDRRTIGAIKTGTAISTKIQHDCCCHLTDWPPHSRTRPDRVRLHPVFAASMANEVGPVREGLQ